jgi:hypothetical protein
MKRLGNDMKGLEIHIQGTTSTLENEVEALVQLLKDLVKTMQASEQTGNVLVVVMHQLAEIDPDTCCWVLDNLYDLEAYLELIEKVMTFATQNLISKGFIFSQDFSANPAGGILIKRKAKAALMKDATAFDRLLLEEILQVLD